jgi:hypothetical protein
LINTTGKEGTPMSSDDAYLEAMDMVPSPEWEIMSLDKDINPTFPLSGSVSLAKGEEKEEKLKLKDSEVVK